MAALLRLKSLMAVALFWLGAYAAVFLWLATRAVERREYVLEQ